MVQKLNPHKLRRTVRPDDPLTRYHADVAVYERRLAAASTPIITAAPIRTATVMERAETSPAPTKTATVMERARVGPRRPHGITQLHFFSYLFIPLSVGMFPHLFQHWLTAKSAKSFRLAVIAHPALIMLVWVPCVLLGVWATSGVIDGEPVIPYGFSNPNAVLGRMVATMTGPVLGGLLTAGILAAIMSSLDSQFLCIGSIFTNDIAAHYLGHDRLSDRQRVAIGRVFVVFIVAITYALAQLRPGGVFTLGVWCFSGFASLFPLVLAAIYWRRATKAGAYACVLTAAGVGLALFAMSGYGANRNFLFGGMMPAATMVAASSMALVVVSLMTRPPSPSTVEKFFAGDPAK